MAELNINDSVERLAEQADEDTILTAEEFTVHAVDIAVKQEEEESEAKSKYGNYTYVSSTGFVLRAKDIGFSILDKVMNQVKEPTPPMVTVGEAGKEWQEENVDDSTYIKNLRDYTVRSALMIANTCILLGIDIVEFPSDKSTFDDDKGWIEDYEAIGISVPKTRSGRYLEWMKLRVVPTTDDLNAVQMIVLNAMGVTEEDIEKQVSSFQD